MRKSKQGRKQRGKKNGIWLYLSVLVISFAVSTGASYFFLKEKFAFESSFIADIEARYAKKDIEKYDENDLRLYRYKERSSEVRGGAALRKDELLVVAEDMIRQHMKPYGVGLLDLYMDKEGVMYIDFGDELKKNFRSDAEEELQIIAGLYKGMKSVVPGFTSLKILIQGKEAESFGGHIDISKPIGEEIAENT